MMSEDDENTIDQNQTEDASEEKVVELHPAQPSLEEQVATLKDQHLRALAEVENIRRRSIKERDEASKYAVSGFAREMLTVADNFRRALDAVPAGDKENETLKHLVTGIEATERQLLAALDRFGIKPLAEPLGKPFDPNFHRVMMEVEDLAQPAGTVVQVLQAGYMIGDRLLREALVAVSKGGAAVHNVDTSA